MHFNQHEVTSAARHQYGGKFANKHGCETKLTSQASSFSAALSFTKELAFGVLAILGCIVVQCLILTFLLLSKAQIRFVFLQAQMLRRLYGRPSEKRSWADRRKAANKTTNVKGNSHLHLAACVESH